MPAVDYIKHLIECNCLLPQFKHSDPPKWHCFVAFSELDELGNLIPSFCQCNNCGMIHKIIEVGITSTMKKDSLLSLPTIDELKSNLPEKLQLELGKYNLPLPTYQELNFVFSNQCWGKTVILSKEIIDEFTVGKFIQIFGPSLWKISPFQEELPNETSF